MWTINPGCDPASTVIAILVDTSGSGYVFFAWLLFSCFPVKKGGGGEWRITTRIEAYMAGTLRLSIGPEFGLSRDSIF